MNLIYDILAHLLPTASVDQAVKFLGKVAERLAAAEARQVREIENIAKQRAELDARNALAELERDRAARIGARLAALTA